MDTPQDRRGQEHGCTNDGQSDTSGWSATRDRTATPADKGVFLDHISEFKEDPFRHGKVETDMERRDGSKQRAGIAVT